MGWKDYLRPSKITWKTMSLIVFISFLNIIFLHYFNFGNLTLALVQIITPLLLLDSLGIDFIIYNAGIPTPNLFGYIANIIFNLVTIYIISLILTPLLTFIRNLLISDSEEHKRLVQKYVGYSKPT